MRNRFSKLFLLLLAVTGVVHAQQQHIQSAKITFEFPSKNVKGSIAGFESSTEIDWEHPENSTFKGKVAVRTLDTRNGLRNWHLRSSKYFAAKAHPNILFESTSVVKTNNGLIVNGKLTLKGITKTVTIRFKKQEQRLIGATTIYASDYNISIKKKREDNEVNIKFDFVLK